MSALADLVEVSAPVLRPDLGQLDRVAAVAHLQQVIASSVSGGGALSAPYTVAKDRHSAFPAESMQLLDHAGLYSWFVPPAVGGRFELPTVIALLRVVSRHDLTTAIAYGKTFLGAAPTWVAGSPEQQQALATRMDRPSLVTWALTERGHGSDLLSGELSAEATPDGYRLSGEKWLINNATRAPLVCLLARTRPTPGPRSFSLFMVDKEQLSPQSHHCLPPELLHGIRGADISGIRFDGAIVGADTQIGSEGTGVETVLRTMQLTRTACTSLSLGAADAAIGIVRQFVSGRVVGDRALIDRRLVRHELGSLLADLMIGEVTADVTAQGVHTTPGEASILAAVAKALVPTLGDQIIHSAASMLGARGILLDEFVHGLFEKIARDHRIVAIFDGNTVVNRNVLISQFRTIARAFHAFDGSSIPDHASIHVPCPTLQPAHLSLMSRTGCSLLNSLPGLLDRLLDSPVAQHAPELHATCARLSRSVDGLVEAMSATQMPGRNVPAQSFDLAEQLELHVAAAAAITFFNANGGGGALWSDALWLRAVLARINLRLHRADPEAQAIGDALMLHVGAVVADTPQAVMPGVTTVDGDATNTLGVNR
ncbi:acyl-CoA dehydrogenase family protein [Williamsia sp. CHRR-6]|uniref:acyl-CoA dehydrogenase family protein n=1 Tax=Williamsia sp. CHRR-6 TaxID=2835871 RepID=UPI001BD9832C|nr:acyl-CoA dehydrogenase family protein [Williamsia sp. CHRR-6]MBT0566974.1 acyl-CoA dehydrogenase family protein [Williamsia sp. CHRR-6]